MSWFKCDLLVEAKNPRKPQHLSIPRNPVSS
uniref:Uncharacterized protein n=1 Tax=Myoviridae sp. ctrMq22 TaxID=2825181 RepID=A0A8S5NUX4_9CAUD|nr:MAG TPA: hypothetical protein [Myoviridae sp. ctrMq22]